jgi:predicted GNAT family acetyltransferase
MHSAADHSGSISVRHEPAASRLVVDLPDGQAELIYREFTEDVLDLEHTEIPSSGRGKGLGDALIRAALQYARERGARVMATCPYVRAWLLRHPDERPT